MTILSLLDRMFAVCSSPELRVQSLQLDAGVGGFELPVGLDVVLVGFPRYCLLAHRISDRAQIFDWHSKGLPTVARSPHRGQNASAASPLHVFAGKPAG
jgi:hypothetical protein